MVELVLIFKLAFLIQAKQNVSKLLNEINTCRFTLALAYLLL